MQVEYKDVDKAQGCGQSTHILANDKYVGKEQGTCHIYFSDMIYSFNFSFNLSSE